MDVSSANKRESPLSIRRAIAEDYDQIVEVWLASGLGFCPKGRDSKQAFRRQIEAMTSSMSLRFAVKSSSALI